MRPITENGLPRAIIVLPEGAQPVEEHAARELRRYIGEISGAQLPIDSAATDAAFHLYVGTSAAGADLDLSADALGFDGYRVQSVDGGVALTGSKPYSCLYAVYHLLQHAFGCGFFEDGDQIPQRSTLEIGELSQLCKPRFEWRNKEVAHFPAYSGHRWYSEQEWKQWFDWLAKTRMNICETNWLARYTGIEALAAAKFGIEIPLTPWQEQNLSMMRRLFAHASMCGIRLFHEVTWHQPWLSTEPGSMPYYDSEQAAEFRRQYAQQTGEQIPTVPYEWCGLTFEWMDPRMPVVKRYISACVQTQAEELGADHYYFVGAGGEGHFGSGTPEEQNALVKALMHDTIAAVKMADPEAEILTGQPFRYASTFEAQKEAAQEVGATVVTGFLAIPQRMPDFQLSDYYWGLRWTNGMVVQCGKHTNLWGDMQVAVDNAQALCQDPKAHNWWGFNVGGESSHREHFKQDLYAELAWDPMVVDLQDFARRWTLARYGREAARRIQAVTDGALETLYSHYNMDMTNRPLYRDWAGGYLPGLTPTSVKRTLSYLPKLRQMLGTLLQEPQLMEDSPQFRFDVVDYGRVYLGALFNDGLARARKAFRAGDAPAFERYAAKVQEIMHFIARFTSAHEQFRMQVHDDRASRCLPILPGHANARSNWVTFTATQSATAGEALLDYTAEDYAELIEHYFWPRVALYLDQMRGMLERGEDISGDMGREFVISDWASPKGPLPWSPYGIACEPELCGGDKALARKFIEGESKSGHFAFYEGPLAPLLDELLQRFSVPDDLLQILSEEDPTQQAYVVQSISGEPGDVVQGFHTPQVVELAVVPEDLGYVVEVEELGAVYNVARGEVTRCKVHVSDWLELTRQSDETSAHGDHAVVVYDFDYERRSWRVRYDPGSETSFAALRIDPIRSGA